MPGYVMFCEMCGRQFQVSYEDTQKARYYCWSCLHQEDELNTGGSDE